MNITDRFAVERSQNWREWAFKIPFIQLKENWVISIIPPFCGAVARFRVRNNDNGKTCSVYLDCFDELGCVGQPYWEVYPIYDDCSRCYLNEVDELIELIEESLKGE